jgi:hypothetical protein
MVKNPFPLVLKSFRVTALDPTPASFGHDAVPVNEHLLLFGGFADLTTQNHTLLLHTSPRMTQKSVHSRELIFL